MAGAVQNLAAASSRECGMQHTFAAKWHQLSLVPWVVYFSFMQSVSLSGVVCCRVLQGVLLEKQRTTPEAAQSVIDNADFRESLLLVAIELVRCCTHALAADLDCGPIAGRSEVSSLACT